MPLEVLAPHLTVFRPDIGNGPRQRNANKNYKCAHGKAPRSKAENAQAYHRNREKQNRSKDWQIN